MRLSLLSVLFTGVVAPALGHPLDVVATDDDAAPITTPAREVELQWKVEVAPGRVETLIGTIEEVVHTARRINPDFQFGSNATNSTITSYHNQEAALLSARKVIDGPGHERDHDNMRPGDLRCYRDAKNGAVRRVLKKEAVPYLDAVQGQPTAGPGLDNCGRVSCSHRAAVWVCSNSEEMVTISSWHVIAGAVTEIINECIVGEGWLFEKTKVNGVYYGDGFYVRVDRSPTKC
ncbi:uncharacterized protein PG986_013968 [Apiospora aurea]|uniref:Uncharacterized protein n=1 Tax=Apiospora aurea TaxID=335848 RepID=A0ABR1PX23_9PEZI